MKEALKRAFTSAASPPASTAMRDGTNYDTLIKGFIKKPDPPEAHSADETILSTAKRPPGRPRTNHVKRETEPKSVEPHRTTTRSRRAREGPSLISLSLPFPLSFRPYYLVSLIVVSLSISGYFCLVSINTCLSLLSTSPDEVSLQYRQKFAFTFPISLFQTLYDESKPY